MLWSYQARIDSLAAKAIELATAELSRISAEPSSAAAE
jgi:hypothetical protein